MFGTQHLERRVLVCKTHLKPRLLWRAILKKGERCYMRAVLAASSLSSEACSHIVSSTFSIRAHERNSMRSGGETKMAARIKQHDAACGRSEVRGDSTYTV